MRPAQRQGAKIPKLKIALDVASEVHRGSPSSLTVRMFPADPVAESMPLSIREKYRAISSERPRGEFVSGSRA
jgi:hypothetical protein